MFSDPKFLTIICCAYSNRNSIFLRIFRAHYQHPVLLEIERLELYEGFIYSVCAALSVAMLPSGTSDHEIGNLTTCDIQG